MLRIPFCFNTIQKYYGRFVPKHPFVYILSSWHISIPAWQLSPDQVQSHCNLESLQEPHCIEPMQGLTPISSHTTIPHLHRQFLPNQTIADGGFSLGRGGNRQAPWKHPHIVHYLVCRCINEPLPQIPGLPSESLSAHVSKQSHLGCVWKNAGSIHSCTKHFPESITKDLLSKWILLI